MLLKYSLFLLSSNYSSMNQKIRSSFYGINGTASDTPLENKRKRKKKLFDMFC
jgi:hypothetical protein